MTAVIDIHDLEKIYNEERSEVAVRAVDGVSLSVDHGESVAIIGPSGCGKSTLMHIIGCLDTPTRGSYLLSGHDVSRLNDDQLARVRSRSIGFIFQTFNLLSRQSALENVALPLLYAGVTAPQERAMAALAKVGLSDRAHHRPSELSGGQKQRVAIARAIVNEPEILLADEPTGALDSKTGAEIMDLLQEQNRAGMLLLVVSHDMAIAGRMARVIRLRDGRIEADGHSRDVLGTSVPMIGGR